MSVLISRDIVREPLYVIVPVYNPWRWRSRYKHTERALKHFHDSGAVIVLVEVAFNRREAVFADSGLDGTPANCGILGSDPKFRHRYLHLRTKDELWIKENAANVATAMALPYDWQQAMIADSDIHFIRPNWVGECIQQLQHYDWVQPFSHARDVGPDYEVLPEDYPHADGLGFVFAHQTGQLDLADPNSKGASSHKHHHKHHGHRHHHHHHHPHPGPPPYNASAARVWPGLAWAYTRKAYDGVGGLLDFAVWGGADYHMAHAIVGERRMMMRNDLHVNYKQMVNEWADRSERITRRNVGSMSGSVFHFWHGAKTQRGYNAKHSLLASIGFDPLRHLKRDYQGIFQLHDDGSEAFVQMRDAMRVIALERNEDSINVFDSEPLINNH